MTRHGQMAAHLLQERSRSSFIVTWPAHVVDFPGGLASSLVEMQENPRKRVCRP